ncbi:MAG: hypothetical protein GX463_00815 [Methanothrix sp.]|nr:hypothetical protein [Methanothrix sp.]
MAISSLEKQDYELLLPYMQPSGWIRRDLLSEFQGGRLWPVYKQMGSNDACVHQPDRDHTGRMKRSKDFISCCWKLGMGPLGAAKEKQHGELKQYASSSTLVPAETNMIQKL